MKGLELLIASFAAQRKISFEDFFAKEKVFVLCSFYNASCEISREG